jgi:ribosomal protein L30/L7E
VILPEERKGLNHYNNQVNSVKFKTTIHFLERSRGGKNRPQQKIASSFRLNESYKTKLYQTKLLYAGNIMAMRHNKI